MRAFHAEGRLAAYTQVAPAGEEQFLSASEFEDLAPLFSTSADVPLPADSGADALETQRPAESPSAPVSRPASERRPGAEPRRFGQETDSTSGEPTRFVIIADMRSGSISALEEEILNLGIAFRFMPQAWVLASQASLNTIRHVLMQKLGKLDVLFIVDAAHDRAAWFNFGPEADTRIRMIWSRPGDQPGADRKSIKRA
jgi:hypothetical protein